MQNTVNVLKNIKYGLKSLSLSLFLVFSVASTSEEYVPIPLDKLVCYGKGTQQQLSPSGEFLAAMVPVDENVCDIKDETDQEMMATDRVLVVTDLSTMEPKVLSGTTAGTSITSFRWLNDKKLLVSRDSRAGLDSASMYTIDRDGKNTTLLIKAKRFKNKPGFEVPSLYGVFPRFPDKVLISLFNSGSRSRDLYWLDINTKRTELVAREPSVPGELVMNWLVDWEGVPRGFALLWKKVQIRELKQLFINLLRMDMKRFTLAFINRHVFIHHILILITKLFLGLVRQFYQMEES